MNSQTSNVLTFEDLQRITGYQRRSDVERSLITQGIRMFRGRTGPWTTLDLIHHAAGIEPVTSESYGTDIL
ncbi:hypothetical protein EIG75_22800 [Pseudomonas syringae]|uniref:DUF4224 domain-containing protein n=4 Tax=Pseudomonas syringae group TaxID=136849 RepID=A0AB37ZLH8_PSESX|nr:MULTISPECIES: hypothetical protein [Pseudomonas]MEE3924666.1 hypothetical protein [Pseudomonas viridiflava]EGH70722.1 hypothetical protein PSYAR_09203 [Pseudomonas syringae pv. aceris str. M302273]KPW09743.1 putative prophage PSSB64-01, Orf2 [Pseudomonas syringae pv. aceris]KPW43555.1 putative prophage PSSB64-01, Orf2 [Pseudomonas syringae pv. antirrhini]KPX47561.1 putative prophage PSSB64-01, Orf2 [Pseudomonas syringae pv. helianthi]